jgi:hypothetical protein
MNGLQTIEIQIATLQLLQFHSRILWDIRNMMARGALDPPLAKAAQELSHATAVLINRLVAQYEAEVRKLKGEIPS